jgi:hypothetical protein
MDSVRAAKDSAKESVLHAADVVAPYAYTAREQAVHYAQCTARGARTKVAPKVSWAASQARTQARQQYDALVAPHVPPQVDEAAQRALVMTRKAARQTADYTVPRVEHAVAATGPVLEEAGSRSTAALAALRGQVTPKDIEKIVRKNERRACTGRAAKRLLIFGLLVGGVFAAWKCWDKQANPDWLVEPPAPTDVDERTAMSSVDDEGSPLDPELEAKEAEAEAEAKAEADAEAEPGEGDDRRR